MENNKENDKSQKLNKLIEDNNVNMSIQDIIKDEGLKKLLANKRRKYYAERI